MEALTVIREQIGDFAGYQDLEHLRLAEEQIRSWAGEQLVAISQSEIDAFSPRDRELYDRLLLRCEFTNQPAFAAFERNPTSKRVEALLDADAHLVDAVARLRSAAGTELSEALHQSDDAFDRRDAAMTAE